MANDAKAFRKKTDLTKQQMRKIVVESIQDVMEGAMTSAKGVTAGGTRIEGRIPVVSSDLIQSLVTTIDGGASAQGAMSYSISLAGLDLGDRIEFSWTMEYARRIEYGFTGTDAAGRTFNVEGWHFVGHNHAKFPQIWEANKRKYII